MYHQGIINDPDTDIAVAEIAIKEPSGSKYLVPPRPDTRIAIQTNTPNIEAINIVNSINYQPKNAPIIASIFTSPIPRPSRPTIR